MRAEFTMHGFDFQLKMKFLFHTISLVNKLYANALDCNNVRSRAPQNRSTFMTDNI